MKTTLSNCYDNYAESICCVLKINDLLFPWNMKTIQNWCLYRTESIRNNFTFSLLLVIKILNYFEMRLGRIKAKLRNIEIYAWRVNKWDLHIVSPKPSPSVVFEKEQHTYQYWLLRHQPFTARLDLISTRLDTCPGYSVYTVYNIM